MPAVNGTAHFTSAPTDSRLQRLRENLDETEARLVETRVEMAQAIQAATENGVTMTHVAHVVGWSRQWCYNAVSRWLPGD